MHQLTIQEGERIYLASDFHLGWPDVARSQERERKIVRWLTGCAEDAALIVLLGDIFDFWFEHRRVIPKGAARLQGKIAELTDNGLPVVLFTGNHDLWMRNYLREELGVTIYQKPQSVRWNNTNLYLAHGDGLGPGDRKYKILKRAVFTNPLLMFVFEHLMHPNWALGLAHFWSDFNKRRKKVMLTDARKQEVIAEASAKPEGEWLWQHARSVEQNQHHDFYIYGHRHIPLDLPVNETSRYINLGEWLNFFTYAVFDGQHLQLQTFEP